MPVVVPNCIIENQLILHSSNGGFEMRGSWNLTHILDPNWSIYQKYLCRPISRKMREVRDTNFHRFCHSVQCLLLLWRGATIKRGEISKRKLKLKPINGQNSAPAPTTPRRFMARSRGAFEWPMMNLRPVQLVGRCKNSAAAACCSKAETSAAVMSINPSIILRPGLCSSRNPSHI